MLTMNDSGFCRKKVYMSFFFFFFFIGEREIYLTSSCKACHIASKLDFLEFMIRSGVVLQDVFSLIFSGVP